MQGILHEIHKNLLKRATVCMDYIVLCDMQPRSYSFLLEFEAKVSNELLTELSQMYIFGFAGSGHAGFRISIQLLYQFSKPLGLFLQESYSFLRHRIFAFLHSSELPNHRS